MIVEITLEDGRRCQIIGNEVAGFEEHIVKVGKVRIPSVLVLMKGGFERVAKFDTMQTFSKRLAAARGGMPLHVHSLAENDRAAPLAEPAKGD